MGNALNNMLSGSYGSDTLDGGLGADTLNGWGGNDTYIVDNVGDVVSETSTVATEIDSVQSSVTYTLGANVENLTLTGAAAIYGIGNELANVLVGNDAINTLNGLDGNDTIHAGAGDGAFGGAGDDTLLAQNAAGQWSYLYGEAGDDILTGGAGADAFFGGEGNDTITGGAGDNYIWGDDFSVGSGNDIIHGGEGYDYIVGGGGDDLILGNGGNDSLNGGAGNDFYVLGRGYAADTIVENDAIAGNTDIAQFLTGVAADQIWFQHVGNNLEASIIGTSDKLVVQDWYLGSANHVEQFKTTDGAKTLLDSNVQNLVNAMASFAPPAAGQTSLPTNYQTSLAPVIAANWQ
jgi:Ca2+-binding RTX toxin-like protein